MKIQLSRIHANPHRNLETNPLDEDQVEGIKDSIGRTGFWENILLRAYPKKKGHYQIAGGGHNRIEACRRAGIKTVDLKVVRFNDWQMYEAMVDENETQRIIGVPVIMENVEAGLLILEPAILKCRTFNQLNKLLELGASADGASSQCETSFTKAKAALESGDGLGVEWLKKVLPGVGNSRVLQAVIDRHYGESRAAKAAREAEELRKKAEEEEDEAESRRLEAEAKQLDKKAAAISDGIIDKNILLEMDSLYAMRTFAAAVKKHKIPASKHKAAANHVHTMSISGDHMAREMNAWWFVASGNARKVRAESLRSKFRKRHGAVGLDDYVYKTTERGQDLIKQLRILQTFTPSIQDVAIKRRFVSMLKTLRDEAAFLETEINRKDSAATTKEVAALEDLA